MQVSPANSFGFMDGGIDMAYSVHFGWQMYVRIGPGVTSYTASDHTILINICSTDYYRKREMFCGEKFHIFHTLYCCSVPYAYLYHTHIVHTICVYAYSITIRVWYGLQGVDPWRVHGGQLTPPPEPCQGSQKRI